MKPRPFSHSILIAVAMVWASALAEEAPLTIAQGTEISWPTQLGYTYQLQSSPVANGPWTDLGAEVSGTGNTSNYHHSQTGYFYQVLETSPAIPPTASSPVNGGFEAGAGDSADNWITGGILAKRTSADAYAGNHSMHVSLSAGGQESLLSQDLVAVGGSIAPGTDHEFSFWLKQGPSSISYIQQYEVQWFTSSGGFLGSTGLLNFTGTEGVWEKFVAPVVPVPVNAAEVKIRFRCVTGTVGDDFGEVLLDDIVFGEASGPGTPGETMALNPAFTPMTQLSWPTVDAMPYQPEYSPDISEWLDLGHEITGDGNTQKLIVSRSATREFYRVTFPGEEPPPSPGIYLPLFDSSTTLEPAITVETEEAFITHIADRARDRHARESQFSAYDHYLSWYWEERTMKIEIIDKVAKGGSEITFNYETLAPLSAAEFRTFFRGIGTVAEYHSNQIASLVGPNQYTATVNQRYPSGGALQVGDRIEIEISMFLASVMNGRNNYYGTTFLYIVGEGVVPWVSGEDIGLGSGIVNSTNTDLDSHPLPEFTWLGGKTTLPYQYSDEPEDHFKQLAGNIAPINAQPFMNGRRLHHTDFGDGAHSEPGNPTFSIHANKLGPSYIGRSCVECHTNNGRALPPALNANMFQSVVRVGSDTNGTPDSTLGSVLQPLKVGTTAEGSATITSYTTINGTYGDGTAYTLTKPNYTFSGTTPSHFSTRLAPPLIGLGLLEAIEESTIVGLADPDDLDGDGISGRTQTVIDPETGDARLGRFTYKAGQARLSHQIASALNTDMGVTTSIFPTLDGELTPQVPELSDSDLDLMTRYVGLLGVSARRDHLDTGALAGEQLFITAQCSKCHVPELTTSPYHPHAELRNQTIRPFTDLLLHDMGPGLADNMGELNASGSEWRTTPLWNIGLTSRVSGGGEAYLHDGRAGSLEEAILWHGGEAEAAKENFRTMSASDRADLIKFLKSL